MDLGNNGWRTYFYWYVKCTLYPAILFKKFAIEKDNNKSANDEQVILLFGTIYVYAIKHPTT